MIVLPRLVCPLEGPRSTRLTISLYVGLNYCVPCDVARSETLLFRGLLFVNRSPLFGQNAKDRQVPVVISPTAAAGLEMSATPGVNKSPWFLRALSCLLGKKKKVGAMPCFFLLPCARDGFVHDSTMPKHCNYDNHYDQVCQIRSMQSSRRLLGSSLLAPIPHARPWFWAHRAPQLFPGGGSPFFFGRC